MNKKLKKRTMPKGKKIGWTLLALLAATVVSCSTSRAPQVEAPPTVHHIPLSPTPQLPKLPPKTIEVEQAVNRVFRDSAKIDVAHQPSFVAGDFNGDSSQDLAVIVKPVPNKIATMNEEYPAWMLRDLMKENGDSGPRLRVEESEQLLAVIHGHGPNDWRDPEATQTYLLKHAVGNGLKVESGKTFSEQNQGKKIPRLHGDLIIETLRGSSGFLYFDGSTYAWYNPKTFRGEATRRVAHARRAY